MADVEIDPDQIYFFEIDDQYYFKYYFDRSDIFDQLNSYYNTDEYRFEVDEADFSSVRETLEQYYFEPIVVTEFGPFCVVKEQYTEHAEILRKSVMNWERRGHHFFVMKDERSVAEAIEYGATPIDETEFVVGV